MTIIFNGTTGIAGAGSVTGMTVANTAISGSITGSQLSTTAQYTGMKNRLINGDMKIWQRGTSLTTSSNQVYGFADRWLTNAGASTTWSQSTDVPTGFKYSVSCAGSTFNGINQRIESYNCIDLAGQPITVSFYAKQSSGSSSININLAYANGVDTFSSVTTIVEAQVIGSPSSSWTRYSYTYTMPSGVINGLQVILFNAAASSTTLYTGIQLEVGTAATSFDFRSFGTELLLCQRYYERSYDIGQSTGSFTGGARGTSTNGTVFAEGPGWFFLVAKRTAPTVVFYNLVSGASAKAYQVSSAASITVGARYIGTTGITIIDYTSSGGQNSYYIHYTADAEL